MQWLHCRMWSCLPPPLPGPEELDGPVHAATSPEPSPATVSVPVVFRKPRLERPVPPPLPVSLFRSSASLRMAHLLLLGVTSCNGTDKDSHLQSIAARGFVRSATDQQGKHTKGGTPPGAARIRQGGGDARGFAAGPRAPPLAGVLAGGGRAHYDALDRPTGGRRRARLADAL